MRRVQPEAIPTSTVQQMVDAAIRAPTGGLKQDWRFVIVENDVTRSRLHDLYREAFAALANDHYLNDSAGLTRTSSDHWLAEHMREVPLLVAVITQDDTGGASTYPAVWSLMLAARGLGVGTTMTTILGQYRHEETCKALKVPSDEGWHLRAVVTCGLPLGSWGVAQRRPAHEVVFQDAWGNPPAWTLPRPMWAAPR